MKNKTAKIFWTGIWVFFFILIAAEQVLAQAAAPIGTPEPVLQDGAPPATLEIGDQDLAPNQKWIEQVDGGFLIPGSQASSAGFGVGLGGDILVGYRFSRDFNLSADLGYFVSDQINGGAAAGEWSYIPIMMVARFNMGPGWIRPYLIFGFGAAFNTYSTTSPLTGVKTSLEETDLLVAPGAGILFRVATNAALYVQGRMDFNFTKAGAVSNPFTGSPVVFIPIKAGISFFVL